MDTTDNSENAGQHIFTNGQVRPSYLKEVRTLLDSLGEQTPLESDGATADSSKYHTLASKLEELAVALDGAIIHNHSLSEKIGHEAQYAADLEGEYVKAHGECGRLQQENEALKRETLFLKEKSIRDHLTGAYNRQHFDESLSIALDRWKKNYHCDDKHTVCLLMVDIDNFTQFNTCYGHQTGDYVLTELIRLLDKPGLLPQGTKLCRYGGEEIGIILPVCNHEKAERLSKSLKSSVESHHFHVDNGDLSVTVSIGGAVSAKEDNPKGLVDRADDALYLVKYTGKNNSHMWDSEMRPYYFDARNEYDLSKGAKPHD